MTTQAKLVTADELFDMPHDGFRYELIRGALVKMLPAGHLHGRLASRVHVPLGSHVMVDNLGEVYAAETGYILASDPDTVRAPDVSFVSQSRLDEIGETERYWPGAPDLAVEVISPNDRYTEVLEKVSDWLDAGSVMVIVVNPRNRTVSVHRSLTDVTILTEDDTLDGADAVPGWTMAVADIFS